MTGRDSRSGHPEIEPDVFPLNLREVGQWLTWKATDDGRKVPRAPWATSNPERFVSAMDAEHWTDFDTAAEWADKLPGFGLAFTIPSSDVNDDHVLVDYDDARDPDTSAIHPTVREHVDRAESYADVSTSGTDVHIFCRGTLPDGVKAIEAALPEAEGFPDAEIEVYDSARYSAMTGDHLAGTPSETTNCQAFLNDLADEFATVPESTPDELLREPAMSKADLADVETTSETQDIFDAIQHTRPRDIRLRSTVTHDRGDGSKSLDLCWTGSKSGIRLAQLDDGWVYRKGMHHLDALQVVALEERIITDERDYPADERFWEAVEALRDRGAHIPTFDSDKRAGDPVAILPDTPQIRAVANGWTGPATTGAKRHRHSTRRGPSASEPLQRQ